MLILLVCRLNWALHAENFTDAQPWLSWTLVTLISSVALLHKRANKSCFDVKM